MNYIDIGKTRLIDTNGRLTIIPKPGSINSKVTIRSNTIIDSGVVFNGDAFFSKQIQGDFNITGSYKINDVDIASGLSTDTSKLMHYYDSTKYALRYNNLSMANLDTSKITFIDRLRTIAVVWSFTVSPIFSVLINFANGINVTGNADISGFTKMGSLGNYEKTVVKKAYISSTGIFIYVAHNIPNFHNVVEYTFCIYHDTTSASQRQIYGIGYNNATAWATGTLYKIDTTNFGYWVPPGATALIGDTIIFRAVYNNN